MSGGEYSIGGGGVEEPLKPGVSFPDGHNFMPPVEPGPVDKLKFIVAPLGENNLILSPDKTPPDGIEEGTRIDTSDSIESGALQEVGPGRPTAFATFDFVGFPGSDRSMVNLDETLRAADVPTVTGIAMPPIQEPPEPRPNI